MSLVRFALRFIVRQALTGKTWADDRVEDSSMQDLQAVLNDNPQPVLLIYTDETEEKPNGRELLGGQGRTSLAIVSSVLGSAERKDSATGEFEFKLPHTDAASEFTLDAIERQIRFALTDTPHNPWADLFCRFVIKVETVKSVRGGSTKEGERFAARQISFELQTVMDPVPGEPVPACGPWRRLLDMLEASDNEDFVGMGVLLKSLLEGQELPKWERVAMRYGYPREVVQAIGLAPVRYHPDLDDESATLAEIKLTGNGETVSSTSEGIGNG